VCRWADREAAVESLAQSAARGVGVGVYSRYGDASMSGGDGGTWWG